MNEPRQIPIAVPELGSAAIRFSLWHVEVGEHLTEGDRVAELLIPGAIVDVSAPTSGTLIDRMAHPDDPLAVHQVIGIVREDY
ncbi:MAG: lipoyl domain-containing protein [Gemmataceae bacterium]|nr:lipoyl domain-containing protein [Gemmata sp.]MDW8197464.1 lipoyl domain-containing protein [Gemmataceae bacterium]